MYDGAGITGLGSSRLCAKVSMATFLVGAVAFTYSAAYVFSSGVSLLVMSPIMVAFFTSLTLLFIAMMSSIVFCVRLTNIGEYDLPIKLSPGEFDYGGMLVNKGGYVQSNSVRAEIMMNRELRKGFRGFNTVSTMCFSAMGVMLCTCAAVAGAMVAEKGSVRGVLNALIAPDPGLCAKLCVITASIALGLLVASVVRYAMCSHGSYMVVLNDGVRKFPAKDVESLADKLYVGASNIVQVRIHKVGGNAGVMIDT